MTPPSRRRLTLNSVLQIFVRVAGLFTGVLVAMLQARALDKDDFGIMSLVLMVSGFASGLLDLGMTNMAVKKITQQPNLRDQLMSALVIARATLGMFLASVSVIICGALMEWNFSAVLFSFFFLLAVPISALSSPQALIQVDLRAGTQSFLLLMQSLLWLAAVALAALFLMPLWVYGVLFFGCTLLQGIVTWKITHAGDIFTIYAGKNMAWSLFRESLPLGFGGIAVTAYYRLGGIILFAFSGALATASFGAAFRLVDSLQAIPNVMLFAFLPLISRGLHTENNQFAKRLWDISSRMIVAVSVIAAVTISVLSGPVIRFLYGDQYGDAASLLQIVSLAFIPICLGWLLSGVVIAVNAIRQYAAIVWIAAIFSIGAAFLFVPQYGATATVWITLGTELFVASSLAVLVGRVAGLILPLSVFARGLFVGVVVLLTGAITISLPVLLSGLLCSVVGVLAAILARLVKMSDVRTMLSKQGIPS